MLQLYYQYQQADTPEVGIMVIFKHQQQWMRYTNKYSLIGKWFDWFYKSVNVIPIQYQLAR